MSIEPMRLRPSEGVPGCLPVRTDVRAISRPIDLSRRDGRDWERTAEDIWDLSEWIGLYPVRPLVTPAQARRLRRVEPVAFAQGLLPGLAHPPRKSAGR